MCHVIVYLYQLNVKLCLAASSDCIDDKYKASIYCDNLLYPTQDCSEAGRWGAPRTSCLSVIIKCAGLFATYYQLAASHSYHIAN